VGGTVLSWPRTTSFPSMCASTTGPNTSDAEVGARPAGGPPPGVGWDQNQREIEPKPKFTFPFETCGGKASAVPGYSRQPRRGEHPLLLFDHLGPNPPGTGVRQPIVVDDGPSSHNGEFAPVWERKTKTAEKSRRAGKVEDRSFCSCVAARFR
jgi:hypothetical protein